MIGWFQFNERSLADWPGVHVRLEKDGLWVERQGGTEPSEVGRFLFSSWCLPQFRHSFEVLLAEGGPDSPHKGTWPVRDRNLQATSHKELFFINNADLGGQIA